MFERFVAASAALAESAWMHMTGDRGLVAMRRRCLTLLNVKSFSLLEDYSQGGRRTRSHKFQSTLAM